MLCSLLLTLRRARADEVADIVRDASKVPPSVPRPGALARRPATLVIATLCPGDDGHKAMADPPYAVEGQAPRLMPCRVTVLSTRSLP